MINSKFTILTFYQFKKINDISLLKNKIADFSKFNKIKGTIILAEEGINGTVASNATSIENLERQITKLGFGNYNPKYSYSKFMPFFRLKVRLKKEIVTLRSKIVDPENITGKKIKPEKWNNLITDKETVLIDVRTEYEWDNVGKPNGKKINLETFFLSIKNNSGEINESFLHDFEKLNISKDTEILVICKSGARSSFVSNLLSKEEYKCTNITDGFEGNTSSNGWKKSGLPSI